jgi:hypothetical protein
MVSIQIKILIITEDSITQLPKIDIRREKIGRGTNINHISEIKQILINYNLPIPGGDIYNESEYMSILKNYTRPAILLFGGMFTEVRSFYNFLKNDYYSELYILSGRYGLINNDKNIIPYFCTINDVNNITDLDNKTNFSEKILKLSENFNIIIILLPKCFIEYFLEINIFNKISRDIQIVVVSSESFASKIYKYNNITLLKRVGVTRIGKKNFKSINEIIHLYRKY